jgi:hypothetical protein
MLNNLVKGTLYESVRHTSYCLLENDLRNS